MADANNTAGANIVRHTVQFYFCAHFLLTLHSYFAVVELMFSWNIVHEAQGDALFADRAEVVAYNAMPGSMTKVMRRDSISI